MTPRIESVSVTGSTTLRVKWKGKGVQNDVNLESWIASGGEVLTNLSRKEIFSKAAVGHHGSAVIWDDEELAIDATHLMMLANEQGCCAIP